jgi:carbamoyl-phosphate synthase large subunit
MEIVHEENDLRRYIRSAAEASPERPILVDRFLEDATEVDVDCIADADTCVIGGIMEHIEQAGIHSGDSACVIPAFSLSPKVLEAIKLATISMARELRVRGLMNVQFAVKDEEVYVLEANPRASRTVPFVSKAIGKPLAKLAALIMAGKTLQELNFTGEILPNYYAVKEAVFPFIKFPGVDVTLGPEMRSTGEVMGIDADLGIAYAKAQMSAQRRSPGAMPSLASRILISGCANAKAFGGLLHPTLPAERARSHRRGHPGEAPPSSRKVVPTSSISLKRGNAFHY